MRDGSRGGRDESPTRGDRLYDWGSTWSGPRPAFKSPESKVQPSQVFPFPPQIPDLTELEQESMEHPRVRLLSSMRIIHTMKTRRPPWKNHPT